MNHTRSFSGVCNGSSGGTSGVHNPPHVPSGAAVPLPALCLRKSQTSRCLLGSSNAGEPPQPGRPGRFCLLPGLSLCQKVLLVRRHCGEAGAEAHHGGKSAEGEHPNNALERLPWGGRCPAGSGMEVEPPSPWLPTGCGPLVREHPSNVAHAVPVPPAPAQAAQASLTERCAGSCLRLL